ncbi:MAG TPA: hypothetical protein VF637_04610 [Sphingomicrobium sp.]
MDILQQAQAKRSELQRELARLEAFLATAYELQQEFSKAPVTAPQTTDAQKADRPIVRRMAAAGTGSVTLQAVLEILRDRDEPLSTRDLLPLVLAKGIEVGGKDQLATLSARISQKGPIVVRNGKWWFTEDNRASDEQSSGEEAADAPGKDMSAASLLHSNQGANDAAALVS